jgi:hypothetical protein
MVMEVTPNHGPRSGIAFRLHRSNAEGTADLDDRIGPWKSEPFAWANEPRSQCLRLKLTTDPWFKGTASAAGLAGHEQWEVRLEAAR